jgi:hypothetical protein
VLTATGGCGRALAPDRICEVVRKQSLIEGGLANICLAVDEPI